MPLPAGSRGNAASGPWQASLLIRQIDEKQHDQNEEQDLVPGPGSRSCSSFWSCCFSSIWRISREACQGPEAALPREPAGNGMPPVARRAGDRGERLVDLPAGARQLELEQCLIYRLVRPVCLLKLADQPLRLLEVQHRDRRAAVSAHAAADEIDGRAAVGAVDALNVGGELGELILRERPDEVLLAKKGDEPGQ